MSVHYKFKSALEYDTVTFDGLHISVRDLKNAIIQQKRIGKNTDFDLQVTNAQTKEVYDDENSLIPKNTSLLIARIPTSTQTKNKQWEGYGGDSTPPTKFDELGPIAKTADLSKLDAPEDDKILAMMSQSNVDYDPSNYQKIRGANQMGVVPPNYRCYKCHQNGHWIKDCPLSKGPEPIEIKKSTGIPLSFMVPVDGPQVQGAMMTPNGSYAVPVLDHQTYTQKMAPGAAVGSQAPPPEPQPDIPEDLVCSICSDLLTDAVMIPCCGNSFCDECIRSYLLESEDGECPDCHEKDISPGTLIPNRFLRNSVANFKNTTGYIKKPVFRQTTVHPATETLEIKGPNEFAPPNENKEEIEEKTIISEADSTEPKTEEMDVKPRKASDPVPEGPPGVSPIESPQLGQAITQRINPSRERSATMRPHSKHRSREESPPRRHHRNHRSPPYDARRTEDRPGTPTVDEPGNMGPTTNYPPSGIVPIPGDGGRGGYSRGGVPTASNPGGAMPPMMDGSSQSHQQQMHVGGGGPGGGRNPPPPPHHHSQSRQSMMNPAAGVAGAPGPAGGYPPHGVGGGGPLTQPQSLPPHQMGGGGGSGGPYVPPPGGGPGGPPPNFRLPPPGAAVPPPAYNMPPGPYNAPPRPMFDQIRPPMTVGGPPPIYNPNYPPNARPPHHGGGGTGGRGDYPPMSDRRMRGRSPPGMLREKDERERRAKQRERAAAASAVSAPHHHHHHHHHRRSSYSRSRSRSFSRSPPPLSVRGRLRSRSPPPPRRRQSRSRSRSFSISRSRSRSFSGSLRGSPFRDFSPRHSPRRGGGPSRYRSPVRSPPPRHRFKENHPPDRYRDRDDYEPDPRDRDYGGRDDPPYVNRQTDRDRHNNRRDVRSSADRDRDIGMHERDRSPAPLRNRSPPPLRERERDSRDYGPSGGGYYDNNSSRAQPPSSLSNKLVGQPPQQPQWGAGMVAPPRDGFYNQAAVAVAPPPMMQDVHHQHHHAVPAPPVGHHHQQHSYPSANRYPPRSDYGPPPLQAAYIKTEPITHGMAPSVVQQQQPPHIMHSGGLMPPGMNRRYSDDIAPPGVEEPPVPGLEPETTSPPHPNRYDDRRGDTDRYKIDRRDIDRRDTDRRDTDRRDADRRDTDRRDADKRDSDRRDADRHERASERRHDDRRTTVSPPPVKEHQHRDKKDRDESTTKSAKDKDSKDSDKKRSKKSSRDKKKEKEKKDSDRKRRKDKKEKHRKSDDKEKDRDRDKDNKDRDKKHHKHEEKNVKEEPLPKEDSLNDNYAPERRQSLNLTPERQSPEIAEHAQLQQPEETIIEDQPEPPVSPNKPDDLYGEILQEGVVDATVVKNYGKIPNVEDAQIMEGQDTEGTDFHNIDPQNRLFDQQDEMLVGPEEVPPDNVTPPQDAPVIIQEPEAIEHVQQLHHHMDFDDPEKADILEIHTDLKTELDIKNEMLAHLPEKSKWEVEDDSTPLLMSPRDSIKSESKLDGRPSGKVVTNEVLKRAENAIFAKAINAIRPIEIKKISTDRAKLYTGEKIPTDDSNNKLEEGEIASTKEPPTVVSSDDSIPPSERGTSSKNKNEVQVVSQPTTRISVKDRLGIKIDDADRVVKMDRNRSRSISPFSRRAGDTARNYGLGERRVEMMDSSRRRGGAVVVDDRAGRYVRDRDRDSRNRRGGEYRSSRTDYASSSSRRDDSRRDRKEHDSRSRKDRSRSRVKSKSRHRDDHDSKKERRKRSRSRSDSAKRKSKKDKKVKKEKTKKRDDSHSSSKKEPGTDKTSSSATTASASKAACALDEAKSDDSSQKVLKSATDKRKPTIDEAQFEPDYDLETESEKEDAKKKHSAAALAQRSDDKSSSSSESSSSSSEDDRKKRKHRKHKKKRSRRDSSSSSSDSDSDSSDTERDRKRKKHKKKRKKRKKSKK